jgi:hypothetical protein
LGLRLCAFEKDKIRQHWIFYFQFIQSGDRFFGLATIDIEIGKYKPSANTVNCRILLIGLGF